MGRARVNVRILHFRYSSMYEHDVFKFSVSVTASLYTLSTTARTEPREREQQNQIRILSSKAQQSKRGGKKQRENS